VGGLGLVARGGRGDVNEYSVAPVMRRFLLVAVALVATFVAPVEASTAGSAQAAPPPLVDAAAWYLVGNDGEILAARDETEQRPIASITKLMTALVVMERARLSDVVRVTPYSAGALESTVYLRAGEELTVAELLRAMLIPSANDAAYMLALHVGEGSIDRFVGLMNEKAQELGLADTTFENPHGLDEVGHVSSARDTTALVRYALGVPFIRAALERETYTRQGRVFPTTDDLLSLWAPLVGGKTGHTSAAGWSEAAAASKGGATVYGSVLGSDTRDTRNEALKALLTFGLSRYRPVQAIAPSRVYARAETGYGRPEVELVARRPAVRTVFAGTPLVERVVAPLAVGLPVAAGQELGRVEILERGRVIASSPLVAAEAVSEPGTLSKALWLAGETVDNLWGMLT
jgi:D-alanyl-D-alanine carboxypeptidase (penicillin-binding protein 5/6)